MLTDLINYNRNPVLVEYSKEPVKKKLYLMMRLAMFSVLVASIAGVLSHLFTLAIGYTGENAVSEASEKQTLQFFVVLGVVMAPLIEELVFRGWLTKNKKVFITYLSIFIGYIAIAFTSLTVMALLPLVIMIIALSLMIDSKTNILGKVNNFIERKFNWFYYLSLLVFAAVHIFNFSDLQSVWYFTPILVMPQFFHALTLGYLRTNIGLIYSIIGHAIINFTLIFPVILGRIIYDDLFTYIDQGEAVTSVNQEAQVATLVMTVATLIVFVILLINAISLIKKK